MNGDENGEGGGDSPAKEVAGNGTTGKDKKKKMTERGEDNAEILRVTLEGAGRSPA